MKLRESRAPYWWLLAVFVVSRILYFAVGVRFDARPVENFFQLADPLLLKTRLFESLWYMHTQPPGFNLIVGMVLKLFPDRYGVPLHVIFLIAGLVSMWGAFRLMEALGVPRWINVSLSLIAAVSPGTILYENFLIYEYPLLALTMIAAWALCRLARERSMTLLIVFFGALTCQAMIRALYHLLFYVMIWTAVWFVFSNRRRQVALVGAVGFLIIGGLYTKNWVLYRSFSGSTWMPYAGATITMGQLSMEEKQRLLADGVISPFSMIPAPSSLRAYAGLIRPVPKTGIPILDNEYDSTSRPNFNAMPYFQVMAGYSKDTAALFKNYPKCYLRSVATAWFAYFLPASDFPFFELNRPKIRTFDRWWNLLLLGQWKDASNRKELRAVAAGGSPATLVLYTGTYLLMFMPVIWLSAAWMLWIGWRRRSMSLEVAVVLGFALLNILFITLSSNFLSSFENNRYRQPVDGLWLVLFGYFVTNVIQRFKPRGRVDIA